MPRVDSVYVEIDLPYCELNFGESPCTATGTPCFNTRNLSYDCQDVENYTETTLTVRFYKDNGYEFPINDDVPTFPFVRNARSSSAIIEPAESMGQRATCSIQMYNSKAMMSGLDKNLIARSGDYERGTFWGKFRARNPFIEGAEVRVYRGYVGLPHDVEHYVIDGIDGPNSEGIVSIQCVDFLRLSDGKKSQFPEPSSGYLAADINETDLSFDVEPVGIGDAEYPASGYIAIGNEAMDFTRVGDTFTVTTRGYRGEITTHNQEDAVQVVGVYESQSVADIINDLIVNYTPMTSEYVPLARWQAEVNDFIPSLYSAFIVKPEPVNKLINELIQQAGLIFYADVEAKEIVLKALKPIISGDTYNDDVAKISGNRDLEQLRVSQVLTFYNQKDPFKQLSEETNYYSIVYSQSDENLYQSESIRKVFSRWIPAFAQSVAQTLNARLLERYQNPPKEFDLIAHRDFDLRLGLGVTIESNSAEDAFGDIDPKKCYLTSVDRRTSKKICKAQEFRFETYTGPGGGSDIIISIDSEVGSVNRSLRDIYNTQYASLSGVLSVTFKVRTGTAIGTIRIGDFAGLTPKLIIEAGAYIVGKGGSAIFASYLPPGATDQRNGGTALVADFPVDVENLGTIAAGGGAGGNGNVGFEDESLGYYALGPQYGGAGAGLTRGIGSKATDVSGFSNTILVPDQPGNALTGQDPATFNPSGRSSAGAGGGLNEPGANGYEAILTALGSAGGWRTTYGGLPGKAIEQDVNINWLATGTIIGDVE